MRNLLLLCNQNAKNTKRLTNRRIHRPRTSTRGGLRC
nr:MAG TPA: hypothetical protein [Caudoviricetes sp.]